jgi:hypothetical protein
VVGRQLAVSRGNPATTFYLFEEPLDQIAAPLLGLKRDRRTDLNGRSVRRHRSKAALSKPDINK